MAQRRMMRELSKSCIKFIVSGSSPGALASRFHMQMLLTHCEASAKQSNSITWQYCMSTTVALLFMLCCISTCRMALHTETGDLQLVYMYAFFSFISATARRNADCSHSNVLIYFNFLHRNQLRWDASWVRVGHVLLGGRTSWRDFRYVFTAIN